MAQTDRNAGLVANVGYKGPCRAATTANITLEGAQTIDGIACVAEDRVLVKDQTDQTENGLYEVDSAGWIRTKDFNGAYDGKKGSNVFVTEGAGAAATFWYVTSVDDPVFGTSIITFANWTGGGGASWDYESAETALSGGAQLTFVHGLGAVPTRIQVILRANTATTRGWADNEEMAIVGPLESTLEGASGVDVTMDATNIYITQGIDAFQIIDHTNFDSRAITLSEYDWGVRASA